MYEVESQYAVLNRTMHLLRWDNFNEGKNNQLGLIIVGGYDCQRRAINKALNYLSIYIPEILAFITKNVNKIVSLSSNASDYHGLSKSDHPKTIFLYNTEKIILTPHILAAGIIHESIHQSLFSVERDIGKFISGELLDPEQVVTSPWTGNQIHLNSFVHAAYVWFGLYFYWRKYLSIKPADFDEALALTQVRKLIDGYLGKAYDDIVELLKNKKQHRAVHSILRLRNIMEIENEKNNDY